MFAIEHMGPTRRRFGTVAIGVLGAMVLVAAMVVALRHGPAHKAIVVVPEAAVTVTCGQTITTSIVVANDLACPFGTNGLNVGANGIIINLNGHVISGTADLNFSGVRNLGFSGVTIENGTLSSWGYGVAFTGPTNKVTGIKTSQDSLAGIFAGGDLATVTTNLIFANKTAGGAGIIVQANNVKVLSNVARENTNGILVSAGAAVVLQTNQLENNSGNGISDQGSSTTMTGNVTNANSNDGIASVSDPASTIGTNTANYNAAYGIEASAGGKDGGGNLAKGNVQVTQCKDVVCS